MPIKAIETRYKGYRFRSRLEARWAVFFDTLGQNWEYEKEGFSLSTGENYLPDFYLPDFDAWVEIKGKKADQSEIRKCISLMKDLGGKIDSADLIALGDPKMTWGVMSGIADCCPAGSSLEYKNKTLSGLVEDVRRKTKVYLFEGLLESGWFFTADSCVQVSASRSLFFLFGCSLEDIKEALFKARSARFDAGRKS